MNSHCNCIHCFNQLQIRNASSFVSIINTIAISTHAQSLWRPLSKPTHRVPDLKLDLFPLNVDHPSTELDSDGEVVHRLEPLVRELEQQAGLAHPCVKPLCRLWNQPPLTNLCPRWWCTWTGSCRTWPRLCVGGRRGGWTSPQGASCGRAAALCHLGLAAHARCKLLEKPSVASLPSLLRGSPLYYAAQQAVQ